VALHRFSPVPSWVFDDKKSSFGLKTCKNGVFSSKLRQNLPDYGVVSPGNGRVTPITESCLLETAGATVLRSRLSGIPLGLCDSGVIVPGFGRARMIPESFLLETAGPGQNDGRFGLPPGRAGARRRVFSCLRRGREFFMDASMSDTSLPANTNPSGPIWDEDLIYETLGHRARRRLLVAIAAGGPRAAADLTGASGKRLDATLKHLISLRAAKLVVQQENPGDGRKYLYALAPNVPVTKTEKGAVLDFGFVTVRL
jgi:DNA-binding transcriptional ArsR family regulator